MALGSGGGAVGASAGGIRAGRAFVELGLRSTLGGDLRSAEAKFNAVGRKFAASGGLLAGVGLGITAPLLAGAIDTLDDLAKINSVAKAFGTTGEGASGLFGALKSIGGDLKEDIEGVGQFVQKVQDAAAGKGGEAGKLFEGLSVSAQELMDLPLEEKFLRMHEAIRKLPQGEQMAKLSMLGGTDSMKKWIDLLALSNEELRDRTKLFAVEQDELDRATNSTKAYKSAVAAVGRAWQQIVIGIAPTVQFLTDGISKILGPTIDWIKANREIATAVTIGGIALIALGGSLLVAALGFKILAIAVSVAGVAIALFKTILLAATTPIALIAAALGVLGYLFITETAAGKEFTSSISEYFSTTADNAKEAWGGIAAAIRNNDLELAAKIGIAFLELEWERFASWLTMLWLDIKQGWQELWANLKYISGSGMGLIIEGLTGAWDDLTVYMMTRFKNTILQIARLMEPLVRQFDSGFAEAIDKVDGASDEQIREGFRQKKQQDNKEFQQIQNQLQKDLQNAQAERDAAREGKKAELDAKVKEIEAKMRELVEKADHRETGGGGDWGSDAKLGAIGKAFGGFNFSGFAAQAFGDTTAAIPKQQLKAADKANVLLEMQLSQLEKLNARDPMEWQP